MEEGKHTQGPWTIKDDEFDRGPVVISGAGMQDEVVAWVPARICSGQENNARLISAAPDLLEACEQALRYIEVDERTHGRTFAAGRMCRMAITKALGRENDTPVCVCGEPTCEACEKAKLASLHMLLDETFCSLFTQNKPVDEPVKG
jgi:hypothetical protein